MSWSRDQSSILIDEYRKYPCLYAVKSKEYKNKHARNQALGQIEEAVRKCRPGVTSSEIKSKWNGLKTNFLSERKKMISSKKSGAGEDDVYHPTLWYFKKMFFINEHCEVREGFDSILASDEHIQLIPAERDGITNFNPSPNSEDEDVAWQDVVSQDVVPQDVSPQDVVSQDVASQDVAWQDVVSQDVDNLTGSPEPSTSNNSQTSIGSSSVSQQGQKRKRKAAEINHTSDTAIKNASDAMLLLSNVINSRSAQANEERGVSSFAKYVDSNIRQIRNEEVRLAAEAEIIQILHRSILRSREIDAVQLPH